MKFPASVCVAAGIIPYVIGATPLAEILKLPSLPPEQETALLTGVLKVVNGAGAKLTMLVAVHELASLTVRV